MLNFNPIIVRFKLSGDSDVLEVEINFNPIIVRFKRFIKKGTSQSWANFNPIIVRFKLEGLWMDNIGCGGFQSYNSSIQTEFAKTKNAIPRIFQSYNSSIQTKLKKMTKECRT